MSPIIPPLFLLTPQDLAWQPELSLALTRFSIAGIEITQATQHYRSDEHLTDPADQGPDNSVRLVANKPAWVRVTCAASFSSQG